MIRTLTSLFVLVITLFITSTVTQAQGIQRTFVSTTGTDSGNCNPTAPCRTFNYAMTQTADGGEVVALTSGGYGAIDITKSVQIVAPLGVHAGISPSSGVQLPGLATGADAAVLVNAPTTATVVLRNLYINKQGETDYGIYATQVGTLHIEGCVVNGFGTGGAGIRFHASGRLIVRDTAVRNNDYGIYISAPSGTAYASVDRCRLEHNRNNGIIASDRSQVTVSNTVATSQRGIGIGFNVFVFSGQPAELNCESCVASNYGIGFYSAAGTVMRVSRSAATNNTYGFYCEAGALLESLGNNMVRGNDLNTFGVTLVSQT
jgi:hypothetical protein